ncbi:MAG: nucleotidyl transferase AbiEii/AbiGii toxin family protein [Thermodesulfobacteriota bacterium]|nr:nucleotidyl transferase AbiEii/AbiGii toxin family protein [Thermodesulfobacteriota bacterium]
MKDYLIQIVSQQPNDFMKRSIAREYLQARILEALQDRGAFLKWAFVGGTALRFLYGMPRYSEYLDFSLVVAEREHAFAALLNKVSSAFAAEGYSHDLMIRDKGAVKSAFIKFRGILAELALSSREHQMLSVRVEVDTNPADGATTTTTVIRRFVALNLLHYDRPSLLAGKLHAVLSRAYTKGRDLFDLVWYLTDRTWPEPNFTFLNNALAQTGWPGPELTAANWRRIVRKRMEEIHWNRAVKDISPFLERPQDVNLLTLENVRNLLLNK